MDVNARKLHSARYCGLRRVLSSAWYSLPVALMAGPVLLLWVGAPLASHVLFLVGAAGLVWLVERARPNSGQAPGLANQITLARALLAMALLAALARPELFVAQGWFMVSVALLVLLLDGVDGWVARRLDQCTRFGARFDMEVDAALIMVLCLALWLSGQVAAWVLTIGVMRYAFVAASFIWPWLHGPLPDSFRRKLVCVLQVSALLFALSPLPGPALQAAVLAAALLALVWSFAVDVLWLWRQRLPGASDSHPTYRSST